MQGREDGVPLPVRTGSGSLAGIGGGVGRKIDGDECGHGSPHGQERTGLIILMRRVRQHHSIALSFSGTSSSDLSRWRMRKAILTSRSQCGQLLTTG